MIIKIVIIVIKKTNEKSSEYDYLFESNKKSENKNYGLRDNFRKDSTRKKTNRQFNRNNVNVKEDPFDNLLKKIMKKIFQILILK